jgi:hypothetical protein
MSIIPENLKGTFNLDWKRMSVPTNNTMYDCIDCLRDNIKHEIIDSNFKLEADYPRYSEENYWVRKCTGCEKIDGPWSHYGDY